MTLFFQDQRASFIEVLESCLNKEFESPTRSTIPLLDALRHDPPPTFVRELLESAGLESATSNLHVEYKVAPGRGRGKASHTDLMAISTTAPGRSLAIEAKWTERRYDTVGIWLSEGENSENRQLVLQGWLDRIAPHAEWSISPDDCCDLVYQMVHRAASACATAKHPAMAYLVFQCDDKELQHEDYSDDLRRLRSVIGNAKGFPFFLAEVSLQPTEAFHQIADLKKGDSHTGQIVRRSLAPGSAPLFDFGDPQICRF